MQLRIPEVTLLEEIGRGAGSLVFRAVHRGHACVVKLPRDRPLSSSLLAGSFEQDVLQLARLSRAGFPRVLQLDTVGETPYAILEQSSGEPLPRVLDASLSETDAIKLSLLIASSLQHLHDAGFVHGGLTPDHILLSDDRTRLTLLDSGSISRPVTFDAHADTRALGLVMRACASKIEHSTDARSPLFDIAEELTSGSRAELAVVVGELQAYADSGARQRSSYPPPSSASVTAAARMSSEQRARSELSMLRRSWDRASEYGGRVVEVVGAAGSGKSRLLQAFADQLVERDVQVLSVKCRDSDWAPFSALKRLLDGHLSGLAQLDATRRAEIEASLRAAAGPMASRIRLLSPRLAQLFGDAPETALENDAQHVFVASMADFLATYLESSRPSVLVVDDIHWLDASSRMVFSRLASRLCPQGHLFVCSARDDVGSREPLERFRSTLASALVETVQLGAMPEQDVSELIADYLGLDRSPNTELVTQLSRLSDGTPLSVLELLRLTLERGYLRPRRGTWQLDTARVQRMRLPASSQALIDRRLALLDESTLSMLRTAAVISRLELALLARVTQLAVREVQAALDAALSLRLIEVDEGDNWRFVHDSVWEALLRGLPEAEHRELHERVAEVLDENQAGAELSSEYEYELARHYAAGLVEKNPRRVFEATRRAAKRAFDACDDALSLSFFKPAEIAASLANIAPDRAFYVSVAEASLRVGATQESLVYFERALASSRAGYDRAETLGRIAWVYHYDSNADACGRALEAALAECGRSVPSQDSLALLSSAGFGLANAIGSRMHKLPRRQTEILCELYAHDARVSIESGRPMRGIASILQTASIASQLPPCRAVVRAELLIAFALSATGREKLWRVRVERAFAMARDLKDPIAEAFCHQYLHVITGWLGQLKESDREARMCVEPTRIQYMELGELCHMCFGMYGVESAMGRPVVALWWAERAIDRVRQSGRAPAMFALLEDAARSTLIALGREQEAASIERRLRFVERAKLREGSYFHVLSFQNRVQRFTERGEFGDSFEALVAEFDALEQDPKQVHLLVVLYYVHVAQARAHQCLRANRAQRRTLLPKLERALHDLEAAATRVRAVLAHARVTRATYLWLSDSHAAAEQAIVEAESLARDFGCAWVSYAAARLRAHMLRERGNEDAALDQARVAELVARQYCLHNRLRDIREEFQMPGAAAPEMLRGEVDVPASTRRHLDALLHISQANSRELSPQRQADMILDELLETLGAERAFLFMRDEQEGPPVLRAARHVGGKDLEPNAEYERRLVEEVFATGQAEITETGDSNDLGVRPDRACLVVALVLREQATGVLDLDRPDNLGTFRSEDATLLQGLAGQVLVAFELASALRERERLEQHLRQAQKMEAIARLSGGIAHDFNNILSAIQMAAHGLGHSIEPGHRGHEDIEDIREAARRGSELTRQLIAISRGTTIPPQPSNIVLGEIVHALMPMLLRLVRADVRIDLDVDPQRLLTMAAPSQIERILMNLCQNASDAMPNGGTITIRAGQPSLADGGTPTSKEHAGGAGTDYALLSVSDTGTGMSEEVRARLFEPFFTTKSGQRGTGLGLANVYAMVQQCGGQIEVLSELGAGATFRIYLVRSDPAQVQAWGSNELDASRWRDDGAEPSSWRGSIPRPESFAIAAQPSEPRESSGPPEIGQGLEEETVLVVDDDPSVRSLMVRTLQRVGYHVLVARDGVEALRVVDGYEGLLDLVVTDVQMQNMDGAQLALALLERDPDLKLLFVSGDGPAELERRGLLGGDSVFLHKPFEPDALIAHVEAMLGPKLALRSDHSADDPH